MFNNVDEFEKCYKNIICKKGLLEIRGFEVSDDLKKVNYIDLKNYNTQPFYSIEAGNDERKIIIIFVSDITSFKQKKKLTEYNKYIENIENKEHTDLVIIYTKTTNPSNINSIYMLSKGFMNDYNFNNYNIIYYKLLQINITSHILVPKHEIMSKEEIEEEIMSKEKIQNGTAKYILKDITDLSYISYQDPQINYIGGKINDVIRITRRSDTAESIIIYKLVTDVITIK
tara:strand:+ start:1251 stop:1937 length:687 start_codon:yes stop_codon:yes gene_type:complete